MDKRDPKQTLAMATTYYQCCYRLSKQKEQMHEMSVLETVSLKQGELSIHVNTPIKRLNKVANQLFFWIENVLQRICLVWQLIVLREA